MEAISMRKLLVFILTVVMFFFLFATPIFAFTTKSGDEVNITDSINDDVYAFGANVTVSGDIDGDLIAAGGRILVNGDVSGDLMAAGGYLNLNGDVGDDARISGGMIAVNGKIRDDLIIGGGQVTLGDSSAVGGDLIVSGGTIEIDGEVLGNAVLSGGSINISGKINGNVKIAGVGDLTITDDAEIAGDVIYSSANRASISDGAIIGGELKETIVEKVKEVKVAKKASVAFLTATYFGGKVVSFLSLFVLGIILLLAIPKVFSKFNDRMRTTVGRCVGAGAIMLFGLPAGVLILFIISIILFITVIGAGLGVIALSSNAILIILYALLIYVSSIFLSFFIGRMVLYRTSLDMNKYGWKVLAYLIGLAIIVVVYSIPFVGWMFRFAGVLFGFGGLMLVIKDWLMSMKKS